MKLCLSFLRHVSGQVGAANAFKQVLFPFKTPYNKLFLPFLSHIGVKLNNPVSKHMISIVVSLFEVEF